MTQTYATLLSNTATITVISSTVLESGDNNFGGIFATAIDYAEGRLWRELDLPVTSVTDTSVTLSSGVRTVNLSTAQGEPLNIETYNIFIPAGTTSSNGTRVPLVPASKAVVDAIYPSAISSNCGQPQFFARVSNLQLMLGPTPDQAYGIESITTVRPAPLSAANSSTWLTQNVPELMQAMIMVFMAGYMRDYGSQADDPKLAQSWENQAQTLLKTMDVDALRMSFESAGWTSKQPSPIATPPRA
jgi:hypothetical protein